MGNLQAQHGASLYATIRGQRVALPQWIKFIDEKTLCAYWHNIVTGETTWEEPEDFVEDSSTLKFQPAAGPRVHRESIVRGRFQDRAISEYIRTVSQPMGSSYAMAGMATIGNSGVRDEVEGLLQSLRVSRN